MATGTVILAFTAACGGTTTPTPRPTPTTPASVSAKPSPTGPLTSAGTAGATKVTVTETEFVIKLSRNTFTPGIYTFVTQNAGHVTHALRIEGPGLHEATTKDLAPGESEDLTVTLQPGTYELDCPVDNHESLGMKLDITVS
ncbi:hypothetical protein E0F15_17130 [Frankia sp. B2]|jgi:uncharacterized cupredoxin-like copper-binding protein|nr:hypothetical protein E0F15_17130 [Frankia sp. B2]